MGCHGPLAHTRVGLLGPDGLVPCITTPWSVNPSIRHITCHTGHHMHSNPRNTANIQWPPSTTKRRLARFCRSCTRAASSSPILARPKTPQPSHRGFLDRAGFAMSLAHPPPRKTRYHTTLQREPAVWVGSSPYPWPLPSSMYRAHEGEGRATIHREPEPRKLPGPRSFLGPRVPCISSLPSPRARSCHRGDRCPPCNPSANLIRFHFQVKRHKHPTA